MERNNNNEITYGFIVRTSKVNISKINEFLEQLENCRIIYQKSSPLKLFLKEEVFGWH